jgi:hypothetical protein
MITPGKRNAGTGRMTVSGEPPRHVIEFVVTQIHVGWGGIHAMTVTVAGVPHYLPITGYRVQVGDAVFEFVGRCESFYEGDRWLYEPPTRVP